MAFTLFIAIFFIFLQTYILAFIQTRTFVVRKSLSPRLAANNVEDKIDRLLRKSLQDQYSVLRHILLFSFFYSFHYLFSFNLFIFYAYVLQSELRMISAFLFLISPLLLLISIKRLGGFSLHFIYVVERFSRPIAGVCQ